MDYDSPLMVLVPIIGVFLLMMGTLIFLSITPISFQYKGDFIIRDQNDIIQFKVFKDGLIRGREIKIDLNAIPPDYVFKNDYKLLSFNELAAYIRINGHLPNIPSAEEMMKEGGIKVGEMQLKLLEKVEELTLYILLLKQENELLNHRICELEKK